MADETETDALARAFSVLSTPTRVALVDLLRAPAHVTDLAESLGISRQAVAKHLDVLVEAGLVEARPGRRGFLPALEYQASASGVFAFKEGVLQLAVPRGPDGGTLVAKAEEGAPRPPAPALLVVHGARRGEWIPLRGGHSWSLGREDVNDIVLAWDPFASARHALVARDGSEWTVMDLAARNRTLLNFAPIPMNRPVRAYDGDVLVVGRSVFTLRT